MLQGEHSAIRSTFMKVPFTIKISVLSIIEWPLKTGFTVIIYLKAVLHNVSQNKDSKKNENHKNKLNLLCVFIHFIEVF